MPLVWDTSITNKKDLRWALHGDLLLTITSDYTSLRACTGAQMRGAQGLLQALQVRREDRLAVHAKQAIGQRRPRVAVLRLRNTGGCQMTGQHQQRHSKRMQGDGFCRETAQLFGSRSLDQDPLRNNLSAQNWVWEQLKSIEQLLDIAMASVCHCLAAILNLADDSNRDASS